MGWWRWGFVGGWVGLALAATAGLGRVGAVAGPWPEAVHLLGHVGLCGGLAVAGAQAAPGSDRTRATSGVLVALGLGVAIEIVQAGVHPVWREAVFDLGVDTLAALLGAALWGRRRPRVGQDISDLLHPTWVVPVGLVVSLGPRWTVLAVVGQLPALAWWGTGVVLGWWHRDVPERGQRLTLFVLGVAGVWAAAMHAYWTDQAVSALTALCLAGATVGALVTAAGVKLSGHVGLPAALGLWALSQDHRVGVLWVGVATVLSIARWSAERHTPAEIGAAWALAASLGPVTSHAGFV